MQNGAFWGHIRHYLIKLVTSTVHWQRSQICHCDHLRHQCMINKTCFLRICPVSTVNSWRIIPRYQNNVYLRSAPRIHVRLLIYFILYDVTFGRSRPQRKRPKSPVTMVTSRSPVTMYDRRGFPANSPVFCSRKDGSFRRILEYFRTNFDGNHHKNSEQNVYWTVGPPKPSRLLDRLAVYWIRASVQCEIRGLQPWPRRGRETSPLCLWLRWPSSAERREVV